MLEAPFLTSKLLLQDCLCDRASVPLSHKNLRKAEAFVSERMISELRKQMQKKNSGYGISASDL